MADELVSLQRCWKRNRDRTWFFVRPGGNWGDALIYAGAEKLARSVGLTWKEFDRESFGRQALPPGAGIYLHGGGGFNLWGSGSALRMLDVALGIEGALVIQGPQTFDTSNPELGKLLAAMVRRSVADEIRIFTREIVSAEFLETALQAAAAIHVDHDTAFHLQKDDILSLAALRSCPAGRYTLLAAREDDEAPVEPVSCPERVIRLDPAYYAGSLSHWLRIHAFARRVISNRLHSAIVSALLGKPVVLLGGSYHKNRSVWEFSLRARGVEWCDTLGGAAGAVAGSWLPGPFARSWKVQRLMLWLRGVPAR